MATRIFAAELKSEGMIFVSLSPGFVTRSLTCLCISLTRSRRWAATDMGTAGGRQAPLTAHQSVAGRCRARAFKSERKPVCFVGMIQVMESLTPELSGRFLKYDGTEIPW
jgi:hypothetical protein